MDLDCKLLSQQLTALAKEIGPYRLLVSNNYMHDGAYIGAFNNKGEKMAEALSRDLVTAFHQIQEELTSNK